MRVLTFLTKASSVVGLAVVSGLAFGQAATPTTIDTTAVLAQINAADTPIGAIGGGVLLVVAILATWHWMKRAF